MESFRREGMVLAAVWAGIACGPRALTPAETGNVSANAENTAQTRVVRGERVAAPSLVESRQPAPDSALTAHSAPAETSAEQPSVGHGEPAPPETVAPPFPASARRGDGEWAPFGGGETHLWTTTLHPHRVSGFIAVEVVAMDLRRLTLEWVVGSGDAGAELLAAKMTPGMLIGSNAVAVFNGGFQARHGHWGQVSHGVTLVEPRPEGCGVALDENGHLDIGRYASVGGGNGVTTYRQTPPCLVEEGTIHPRLLQGDDSIWAGKGQREKTRRRSALALDQTNSWLFYIVGVETEPIDLARAIVALGAGIGVELDINWNWTRFFLVEHSPDGLRLGDPLLEGMVMDSGEYVKRPAKRDFFIVRRRGAPEDATRDPGDRRPSP